MAESGGTAPKKGTAKNKEKKKAPNLQTISIEDIKSGIKVALGSREVFWRLDSGKLQLNAFTGETSAKVDAKGMYDHELMSILNGIRTGRLVLVDKITKSEPPNTRWILSEFAPGARKLLDYPDDEFKDAVGGNYSKKLLQTALEIEKEGANRKERISILNDKLMDIVRSA